MKQEKLIQNNFLGESTMKKLLSLILAVIMLMSLASCANDDPEDTGANSDADTSIDTSADTAKKIDTETKDTEDTIPLETEEQLPVQENVPCNFDESLDLSDEILVSDFVLNDCSGQWILGDDATQMTNALTAELLGEYKYFAITYVTDYCESQNEIALMFKYVHTDGTKTEYLCHEWQEFGPVGRTFEASSFAKSPIYGEGVFYVPTELFLTNEHYTEGDIVDQIGFAAVEDTATIVYLEITGAYLTK